MRTLWGNTAEDVNKHALGHGEEANARKKLEKAVQHTNELTRQTHVYADVVDKATQQMSEQCDVFTQTIDALINDMRKGGKPNGSDSSSSS